MKKINIPICHRNSSMKRMFAAGLCIIMLLAFSQSAFALELSFMDEVRAGNYLKAIEVYKSDILGNSGKEMQAQDKLGEYLNEALNLFINDQLTDQEIRAVLYTVEKVNNELYIVLPYIVGDAQLIYREVAASKADYQEGVVRMEHEDYESAIEYFQYVSVYDTQNYTNAQRKIEECHIAICNLLLDNAEAMAKKADYFGAFKLAEEIVLEYPETTYGITVRDKYCSLYIDQVINEAKEIYEATGDYDQAEAVLKRCLGTVGDNEKLNNEIAWYESRKPIPLTDLEAFETENKGLRQTSSGKDIFGVVYNEYPVLEAAGYPDLKTIPSSSTYYLGGEYSTFTGTIFLGIDYKDTKNTGYIRIYGDGILLFEESEIKKGYYTSDFTVDITGVQELKVEISAWYDYTGGLYDYEYYELYPSLTNAVLLK